MIDAPGRHVVQLRDLQAALSQNKLLLLSIEELAVNELRETFHRWIRTVVFPVADGALGDPRGHVPARELRATQAAPAPEDRRQAGDILEEVDPDVRRWLRRHRAALTDALRARLAADGAAARRAEDQRYRQRQGEVSALIEQSTITRLEREIEDLNLRAAQGVLFDAAGRLAAIERSIDEKREEIERRRRHYEEIRDQLQRERARILDHLLPAASPWPAQPGCSRDGRDPSAGPTAVTLRRGDASGTV